MVQRGKVRTDRENQFEQHRALLFSLAYRMLGTRADAEDVVQDAYLRWMAALEKEIRSPKAYLTTVVARLALDSLRSARRKREVYVGPWLPEPLVDPEAPAFAEMAESLSIAFLHVLESLSPAERVAFLLREVFDSEYGEIAAALDTSEANCRQIVARARKHLHDRRARYAVDPERHRQVLRQFLEICATGDASRLTPLLSADAVLYSDGGGKVHAALQPIEGADRVSRFVAGVVKKTGGVPKARLAWVNGEPGALLYEGATLSYIVTISVDDEGRVRRIFYVANPEKLPREV